MAQARMGNTNLGQQNTGSKGNQIIKSQTLGEPSLEMYGHEGMRGALIRSSRPDPMFGRGIAKSVIDRVKSGQ